MRKGRDRPSEGNCQSVQLDCGTASDEEWRVEPLASFWVTRDFLQGRCLARLGLGVRRDGSLLGCPLGLLSVVLFRFAARRTPCEAWLQRGLPSS
jgi:hypothetical protein